MGQIILKEFIGGLDARRLAETTPGGVLIRAEDGHISRGGEFEKRAAFVSTYDLPPDTVGMAYMRTGIVVFGSIATPAGLPIGVGYQQLQHPDGETRLIEVPSFDLYSGKIYAVGVFADGSRHHFYDGDRVEDWFDGRARVAFRITAGGFQEAIPATGSFTITGGTLGGGNEIASVTVNGVTVTSGAVAHTGANDTTAQAVAANITAHTSSPNYSAIASGATVFITAVAAGSAPNGFVVVATPGGDATVADETAFAGGAEAGNSLLSAIRVNGVDVMLSPVEWSTSNTATAQAVAAAINASLTDPEYTAIAVGDQVVILATTQGSAINDATVLLTTSLGFGVTPVSGLAMSGGAEAEDTFEPGTFVMTIGSKMHSVSGPNLHFSGIQQPTQWTTDATGAGFVDMSSYASGSEELTALAKYQDYVAVFAETNIQIWYVDPDPTLNRTVQVLNNTGTASPRSVTQFGDNDLFYLNESGIRSLRARDSSNAASTTDIGVPIDPLVIAKLETLSPEERASVIGLIEPRDGRFWMIMKDQIFVLSFFSGGNTTGVSAWTVYNPGFDIGNGLVFNRRVHLRSGNTIYVYGGLGNALVYDDTEAWAQTAYLDGDWPSREKTLTGIDVAARGQWTIYVAMNINNPAARDKGPTIGEMNHYSSTFGYNKIPMNGASTHFSLIFRSRGDAAAIIGSAAIHFTSDADEDK